MNYAARVAHGIKVRTFAAGLSREDLATALGVGVRAISLRNSGKQEWTLSDLELLAPILGTTPEALASPTD